MEFVCEGHSYLQHREGGVLELKKGQRDARLMLAIHRKKVVERDFGCCRFEKWLNPVYAVLQGFKLEKERIRRFSRSSDRAVSEILGAFQWLIFQGSENTQNRPTCLLSRSL